MTEAVLEQAVYCSKASWRRSVLLRLAKGQQRLAWMGWRGSEALVLGVFTVCGLLTELLRPVRAG